MRNILFIAILFLSNSVFSQNIFGKLNWVKVYPNYYLYASKTEVSNKEYSAFVNANRGKIISDLDTINLLPDSSRWSLLDQKYKMMEEYYYRHPAYQNYPVVNVSKEQAQLFCEWKTKEVNKILKKIKSPLERVIVRIPTSDEWKYIATSGHPYYIYSWEGNSLRYSEGKNMGMFRCNFNSSKYSADQFGDFAELTAPVYAYQPNELGVFNTSGNVAEFVQDEDFAYGGHYFSSYEKTTVNSKMNAIAMPTNGFRYVIEVIKINPTKATLPNQLTKKFLKDFFVDYQFGDTLLSKSEVPIWLYKQFTLETSREMPEINEIFNFSYDRFIQYNYFTHSTFYNQPIFGISPDDAKEFCEWFEKKYEEKMGEKVSVSLPTASNWYSAVKINEKIMNEKGLPIDTDEAFLDAQARMDNYAIYYKREKFFFDVNRKSVKPYNDLLGNVAEIVISKGDYAIVGHSVQEKVEDIMQMYRVSEIGNKFSLTGFRIALIH